MNRIKNNEYCLPRINTCLLPILLLIAIPCTYGQTDDLSKLVDEQQTQNSKKEFVRATFKTTRIVNGHSIENVAGGVLDFRVSHRFGSVDKGIYELFGLDNATMRMGFEYGLTDWWMIGLGRSTFEKTYDLFTKVRILRQHTKGNRQMPLSLSYLTSMEIKTLKFADPDRENYWTSNFYYTHQLLIARKFGERLSFQLMPTVVHWNLVPKAADPNDMVSLGAGGRMKLSKRVSLNAEYYYQIPGYRMNGTTDAFSVGFDIETGGHVFQLMCTNSIGIVEKAFITQTTNDWLKGQLLTGFTISRVFTLKKSRKEQAGW